MIQAGLGKFFAARFRSGVLFAIHLRTGSSEALEKAITANHTARNIWADLANTAKGIYRDDITFGPEYFQRGHWLDRLPAIDADIADMKKLLAKMDAASLAQTKAESKAIRRATEAVFDKRPAKEHLSFSELHKPATSFQRGQPLAIVTRAPRAGVAGINLRYRHVNQAERWLAMEMDEIVTGYEAIIPADYTDSRYPLQYYFQVQTGAEVMQLHPGLHLGWNGQPYFVVRQA